MNLQTKADFTALMHKFLDPLKPYYSAGCSRLHLGETGVTYNQNAIELEAFSRPLWALVPFWVGGGSDPEFEKIYRKGLAAGADPENPEYWGTTGEYDQCYVEMAAIACGILTAPEKLWTPLSDTEKQNLAAWLGQINAHTIPDCNWQFFRILVNLALKSVGMPYSPELLEDGLCKIDSYYSGDGWSTDGASVQKDYYIPWAIQYYGLLYSKFAADTDPRRAALYRQRAQLFAQQFVYWFDANGAALPFGRSLTYRFAQNSFWAACIWAGLEPLPLPVMKGLIVRNFKIMLRLDAFNPEQYVEKLTELAQIARKNGLLALEEKAKEQEDPFFQQAIMLIVDANDPDRVRNILENDIEQTSERHQEVIAMYERGSNAAPAFGMIGTLIGLINMLKNLSDSDMETLGPSMSVALITTFYGSLLAHVLFNPIASNLTARDEEEILCRQIIVEGIMAIQSGENPKFLRERLMTFMNQKLREGGESGGGTGEKKERKRRKEK